MSRIELGLPLSFSREYDVRRGLRRHMLGARIAQRRQVDPRKERLTTAEQDRRDRDVHFVDEARLEILAHRGRPAADLDIEPACGLPGATERFLNSAGDEMKDGPAFHRDRFARVVRQHEHRHVIRRVLAPPAAPLVVGPRPAHGAEHVSAHDIRTDAFPEALGKIVVGTRRPARLPVHLAKRARADVPAVQLLTTHAEWVLPSLAGAGAVPVERDREVVDAQLGHGILRWFTYASNGPSRNRQAKDWSDQRSGGGQGRRLPRGEHEQHGRQSGRGHAGQQLAASIGKLNRHQRHDGRMRDTGPYGVRNQAAILRCSFTCGWSAPLGIGVWSEWKTSGRTCGPHWSGGGSGHTNRRCGRPSGTSSRPGRRTTSTTRPTRARWARSRMKRPRASAWTLSRVAATAGGPSRVTLEPAPSVASPSGPPCPAATQSEK